MYFPSSCKLGNKRRSSVDGGRGRGCRKTDNVFVEKKNGISILSKNDFYFMHLFQIFTEQNEFSRSQSQKIKFPTNLFLTYAQRSE